MVQPRLRTTCLACGGKGVVPREAGKTTDGINHPQAIAPLWPKLCETCAGTGLVPDLGPKSE